eukprot:TRINITY_DN7274_c0_g1_i1.p1 TRINITY_DN7274_c0_g1~~TRINITY_DN7274_c0_g1_i1.p1  ORF type:complete len:242 (-),score=47.84 TRINITY_DN7274_c0_g1_i1:71-796(-)
MSFHHSLFFLISILICCSLIAFTSADCTGKLSCGTCTTDPACIWCSQSSLCYDPRFSTYRCYSGMVNLQSYCPEYQSSGGRTVVYLSPGAIGGIVSGCIFLCIFCSVLLLVCCGMCKDACRDCCNNDGTTISYVEHKDDTEVSLVDTPTTTTTTTTIYNSPPPVYSDPNYGQPSYQPPPGYVNYGYAPPPPGYPTQPYSTQPYPSGADVYVQPGGIPPPQATVVVDNYVTTTEVTLDPDAT